MGLGWEMTVNHWAPGRHFWVVSFKTWMRLRSTFPGGVLQTLQECRLLFWWRFSPSFGKLVANSLSCLFTDLANSVQWVMFGWRNQLCVVSKMLFCFRSSLVIPLLCQSWRLICFYVALTCRVCVRACVHPCVFVYVCLFVCVRVCRRACVRVSLCLHRMYLRACVCVCSYLFTPCLTLFKCFCGRAQTFIYMCKPSSGSMEQPVPNKPQPHNPYYHNRRTSQAPVFR